MRVIRKLIGWWLVAFLMMGHLTPQAAFGLTVSEEEGLLTSDWREAYKIPSTLDLPQIETVLVEQPVPSGPFGAKGVGEIGVVGIAPAVANAVYNAIGVRLSLPITPQKVLEALGKK